MDRRQFGRLVVGAGAATAGAAESTQTLGEGPRMQRVTCASSSDLLNLPTVTKTGFESLHRTPHDMFKAGQAI